MTSLRLLPVLSLTAALLWGAAVPASASCAMPPGSLKQRLNDASIVFVGTVDSADSMGRVANVLVESVWKGDVDEHVQVQGGPADPQTATSVDRSFDVGTRYLFVPVSGNGQVFEDNACTDTQQWTKKLDRRRPDGATAVSGPPPAVDPAAEEAADEGGLAGGGESPAEAQATGAENYGWLALTAAGALAAVAVVVLLSRRSARRSLA